MLPLESNIFYDVPGAMIHYANSKNLSEQEKKAKMLETVATSEAYIVKSLSSAEASNRLSNLTDEQREQYNYVNYRLNRIFEEEMKFLYKSTETVMNVISDPEHANAYIPQTSREEKDAFTYRLFITI